MAFTLELAPIKNNYQCNYFQIVNLTNSSIQDMKKTLCGMFMKRNNSKNKLLILLLRFVKQKNYYTNLIKLNFPTLINKASCSSPSHLSLFPLVVQISQEYNFVDCYHQHCQFFQNSPLPLLRLRQASSSYTSRERPKSETLQMRSATTRTFLAARSRCTTYTTHISTTYIFSVRKDVLRSVISTVLRKTNIMGKIIILVSLLFI